MSKKKLKTKRHKKTKKKKSKKKSKLSTNKNNKNKTKIHKKPQNPKNIKNCQTIQKFQNITVFKSEILGEKKFQQKEKEKSSLFLNIRNTRFAQSSPFQRNHEKKYGKILKKSIFYLKITKKIVFYTHKNSILLCLPIE